MKFHLTMLSLRAAAALILLSGIVESLQCYWCGPLAEQVHRSQRAPSCDAIEDHVTACEPGYTHCAVVASSPPFVESRYCVKFYQDECYTLYCNSTKTFRMICPCRGELCNGANTQREIDAFAVLSKAIAKSQTSRLKKRNTINSDNIETNQINKNKTENLVENEEDNEENVNIVSTDMDDDRSDANKSSEDNQMNALTNKSIEHSETNDLTYKSSGDIQMNDLTNDTLMQSDQPSVEHVNSEKNITHLGELGNNSISNHAEVNSETDIKTTTACKDTETCKDGIEMTTPKSMEERGDSKIITTTESVEFAMVQQHTVGYSLARNEVKPSLEIPTAEALQQNNGHITTSEIPTFPTTTDPKHETSQENDIDTSPTLTSRNNAIGVSLSACAVMNTIILSYIHIFIKV